MVLLGGYAGLRFGQLAALRMSSFGVGFRTVTVTETLTDVRGVVRIGPPKTSGFRTDDLPTGVPRRRALEQLVGAGRVSPLVDAGCLFPAPEGGPIRPSNWRRRVWAPTVHKGSPGAPRTPSGIHRPLF